MKVGIREHFDSMHRLPGHPKCGIPHGHTYTVEVAIEGPMKDGMVIDFDELKSTVRSLLATYDHRDLNEILPYPSCENIALDLHGKLRSQLSADRLAVRVWEGEGKWAEYEG